MRTVAEYAVLEVWFYSKCYLRFCCVDYDPDDLDSQFAHLTNNSIQKNCDEFDDCDDGAMATSEMFEVRYTLDPLNGS